MVSRTLLVVACLAITCGMADSNIKEANRQKRDVPGKLKIVTIGSEPYVFITQTAQGRTYTGFLPDLIYKLSHILNFEYEFYASPDGKYGSQLSNGSWNGMMGQVISQQADFAAAPLTITSKRTRVVDFVKPFHHLGLTLVVQKAYANLTELGSWPFDFSVLKPLKAEVWGLVFIALIVVGLLLWAMNHFNPYEWGARFSRGQASEQQKDTFGIAGSLWFAFSTMQWQGFERAPRSAASKVLTCFWFAFVTMFLVTYTGSLVNHLFWASVVHGVNPTKHPITDLKDLVMGAGKDFKYGCVRRGSTYSYIVDVAAPKWPEFNQMKNYFNTEEGQASLVDSTNEGIAKVRQGKYAFIMETMSARYLMNKSPCDLTTIGDQFAMRSYGLAMPIGSELKASFDHAILTLQESGELDALEERWWTGRGDCWNTTQVERHFDKMSMLLANRPKRVSLAMFWGPLVILLVGALLSVLVAAGEMLYFKYKGRGMQERLTDHGRNSATRGDFET